MANFKITATTTVAELKEQFHNEFGGILRVYQGRSEAPEDATLVSLGGKVGELECRASRTVGKFIEAFQSELGLKVKVYTKDNWVSVLDGITLATVREIPKNARKAQMEQYLAYQRDEKEEVTEEAKVEEDEYILFVCDKDGVTVKSQDKEEVFLLKAGENKVYLKKYPFLRDGFILNPMNSEAITDIDFSHVAKLRINSMNNMFQGLCVDKLDITHLDTSDVTEVSSAFSYAKIGILDISGLDLSNIDPEWSGLFMYCDGLDTIIMNGCNVKTIANVKNAIRKDLDTVSIISDITESPNYNFADFTESKLEDIKSRGGIVVAMSKCNAKDAADLRQEVGNGDVVSVITFVDDAFHYLGDEFSSIEDFEEKDIDFDNLYLIYDENGELDELNLGGRVYSGSYLSEDEWSHYQSDNYPSDDNALCYVMTEALTGDDTGHVNGGYFDAPKVFICDGKIIAECD